MRTLGMN